MFGSSGKSNGKQSIAAISTLIAEGTTIRGDVQFGGGLHLEGVIDGSVSAEGADSVLTLSDKGRVNGEVRVANAVINGTVNGDIFVGERLESASAITSSKRAGPSRCRAHSSLLVMSPMPRSACYTSWSSRCARRTAIVTMRAAMAADMAIHTTLAEASLNPLNSLLLNALRAPLESSSCISISR